MVRAGQRLREARLRKKLSIEDVAKATKIRAAFLSAIEKGEFQNLPSAAYATGFVRNYATYLNLPEKELLAVFRREFDEEQVFKVLPDSLSGNDFPRRSVRIQQTLLVFFALLIIFLGYIGYQYRFLIVSPPLSIESPREQAVTSQQVEVVGQTDSNATITINTIPVTVDADGNFRKRFTIFPGKTVITVKAKNRLGKETELKRTITVEKATE